MVGAKDQIWVEGLIGGTRIDTGTVMDDIKGGQSVVGGGGRVNIIIRALRGLIF